MLAEQSNSKKQGDVGLGAAIGWFVRNGYTVCVPLTDSQDYDLIVDKDCGLERVQVKTTYCKNTDGAFQANLRVCGGNRSRSTIKMFDPSRVEVIFILTEAGTQYLIPAAKVTARTALSLGPKWDKYIIT